MMYDQFGNTLIKANKNETSKRNLKLTNDHKNMLKAIWELPIQAKWLSNETIEKILRDATVESSIGSRKAATLRKEISIVCDNETMKKELESVFNYDVLDSILDTPYYGFNVFEINWEYKDGFVYPSLEDRDYKDFILDNRVLKFYANYIQEDILPHKALYTTYRAKAKRPYGKPILNTLFWLVEFKNASLEFWVQLLEKFGTPWVIGKTEGNKDDFADEIYNMLGGDGAVIDTEDSLEIKTLGGNSNNTNYKELIEYIDNQISRLILGGNLTSNVSSGSKAAATVHNDIREDLAKADENIVNKVIKTVIKSFKELNSINEDIIGMLKDKDDPINEFASRDKLIYEMGYQPTQEYIEKTYNIKVEKIQTVQNTQETPLLNNKFKFSKDLPQDQLEVETLKIDLVNPLTFQEQIINIVEKAESFEDMIENLMLAYPDMNTKDLEDKLSNYIQNAHILATAEIEEENPNG